MLLLTTRLRPHSHVHALKQLCCNCFLKVQLKSLSIEASWKSSQVRAFKGADGLSLLALSLNAVAVVVAAAAAVVVVVVAAAAAVVVVVVAVTS